MYYQFMPIPVAFDQIGIYIYKAQTLNQSIGHFGSFWLPQTIKRTLLSLNQSRLNPLNFLTNMDSPFAIDENFSLMFLS